MSLTLAETKLLIDVLGIVVADALLNQKARTEEFASRLDQLTAQAKEKPEDWRLKSRFDETIAAAASAAGQHNYDAAFTQLSDGTQICAG